MKVTAPMTLALAALASAEARYNAGGRNLLAPRHYQYSRGGRDLSMDLVSEILSSPMYNLANSIMHHDLSADSVPSGPNYAVTQDKESGLTTLRMELPGVSPKDLEIELENDSLLRIKGSRKLLAAGQVMEFERSFQLDDGVDPESIRVTLENGILEVVASKKAKTVKRFEIHSVPQVKSDTKEVKTVEGEEQDPEGLTVTEEE